MQTLNLEKYFYFYHNKKNRKPLQIKASGESGVKWARTIDLHDVNVTL